MGTDESPRVRVCSTLNFLASPLCGRDAIAPSTPTPLPRSGGEGRIVCFCTLMKASMAPLAPERGEGPGVRGEGALDFRVRNHE